MFYQVRSEIILYYAFTVFCYNILIRTESSEKKVMHFKIVFFLPLEINGDIFLFKNWNAITQVDFSFEQYLECFSPI